MWRWISTYEALHHLQRWNRRKRLVSSTRIRVWWAFIFRNGDVFVKQTAFIVHDNANAMKAGLPTNHTANSCIGATPRHALLIWAPCKCMCNYNFAHFCNKSILFGLNLTSPCRFYLFYILNPAYKIPWYNQMLVSRRLRCKPFSRKRSRHKPILCVVVNTYRMRNCRLITTPFQLFTFS